MIKKLLLFILFVFAIIPMVNANYQYANYGFEGYQFGTTLIPQSLWGSQMASTSFPTMQINSSSSSTSYLPIIVNFKKNALSTEGNNILTFSPSAINIYDNHFTLLSGYIAIGQAGNPTLVDASSNYTTYMISYLSRTGSDYNIILLNKTGAVLTKFKSINVTDRSYSGDIKGSDISHYAYLLDNSSNITRVDLEDGTETIYPYWLSNTTNRCFNQQYDYGQNWEINDYDGDGYDDILVMSHRLQTPFANFGLLNTFTGTYTLQASPAATNACDAAKRRIITGITLGYGSDYILTDIGDQLRIYDYGGNIIYTDTLVNAIPSVADINVDGRNELMYPSGGYLKVIDDTFSLIHNINGVTCAGVCAFGKTGLGDLNKLAIYDSTSMKIINSSWADAFPVCQFGGSLCNGSSTVWGSAFAVLPVAIQSRDTKDLFLIRNGSYSAMFSTFGGGVCGNMVCDIGETALTCPADCTPADPTDAILTSVSLNPCNKITVLQNTTLKVTATGATVDNSNVALKADFCSTCPAGCFQSQNITSILSGSSYDFMFIANCTGTNEDMVVSAARSDGSQADPNTLTFLYNIDTFGIGTDDATCGVSQPLSILPPSNLTGNGTSNGIHTGLVSLSLLTGLSGIILWLILMALLTIGILIVCVIGKIPAVIMFGIEILVNILMTVIGSFLKVLPVSFVIIIALALVMIVGLWFRSIVTGSSQGG